MLRTVIAAAFILICPLAAAQTSELPAEPIVNTYPVLSKEVLTHVYDYEWFSDKARLDLGADSIGLCDYNGGRLCITSARIPNTINPTSYSNKFEVYVRLSVYSPTGEVTPINYSYTYCNNCGRICRKTPIYELNGSRDSVVTIDEGEAIRVNTITYTVKINGKTPMGKTVSRSIYLDGEKVSNGYEPSAGTHTVLIISEEIGNNHFGANGTSYSTTTDVGYKYYETTFTLIVKPEPVALTFTKRLTIASRPADGTTDLGTLTLPTPDNLPEGGSDPAITIAEIDNSAVSPEPGTYTVRYRLTTDNEDYIVDSAVWYETSFTITDPITEPLIDYGAVLPEDILTHVYDFTWYTNGGKADLNDTIELCACEDGKILISNVFIGNDIDDEEAIFSYPTGYADALPVYASLLYVTASGDTVEVEGRRLYCSDCGTVTRQTPVITLNDSENEEVTISYGAALSAQTTATGGVEIYVDGVAASNGDIPTIGTHTVLVVSVETGNDVFTPAESVVVGHVRAEKTFTVTVAAPEITLKEPLIDYGAVIPEDLLTHIYDYTWYTNGGQVALNDTIELCAYEDGKILISNVFIGNDVDNKEATFSYPASYASALPVYASLLYVTAGGDTVEVEGRRLYCADCGTVTRQTPVITLNDSESEEITISYGTALNAQTTATGGVEIYIDGVAASNGDIPTIGTHTVRVVSAETGNDVFTPAESVVVGHVRAEKTFSVTVAAPEITLTEPLIDYGAAIPEDLLTHIYDYTWYTNGGEADLNDTIELCAYDDGKILISNVFIGNDVDNEEATFSYPTGYANALPVYASLLYVTAGGDTVEVEGRRLYCADCGTVTRQTPVITLNDSESEEITISYGTALNAQTTATGGVEIYVDGVAASNGDIPTIGTHTVLVVSAETGNDVFTPAESVVVGHIRAEKTFTVSVAAPEITLKEPLIDYGAVIPEDMLTHVFTASWYGTGEVGLDAPIELTTIDEVKVLIADVFIGTNGNSATGGSDIPGSYDDELPVYVTLLNVTNGGDTVVVDGRYLYCKGCGSVVRKTPVITINGSEETDIMASYGEILMAKTSAKITYNNGSVPNDQQGGILIYLDGEEVTNGMTPSVGVHTIKVISKLLEHKTSESYIVEGFARTEKVFTVTVTSTDPDPEPDPDPDPDPDPEPESTLKEPLINYGAVIPEELLTHVFTASWYGTGEVGLDKPIELTTIDGVKVLIADVFIGTNGNSATGGSDIPGSYDDELPVYVTLLNVTNGGDTVVVDGRYLYCKGCGSVTRKTPVITINGSEETDIMASYGEILMAKTSAKITYNNGSVPNDQQGGILIYLDGEEVTNGMTPSVGVHTIKVISKLLEHKTSESYIVEGFARTEKVFTVTVEGEMPCTDGMVRLKFGNTLIVDNSGGEYTAYQWVVDGTAISGATKQYYHVNPLPNGSYTVVAAKEDGSSVESCPVRVEGSEALSVRVVSQPDVAGREVVVAVGGAQGEEVLIVAYSVVGVRVAQCLADSDGMARLTLPRGISVVRAVANDRSAEVRVLCK